MLHNLPRLALFEPWAQRPFTVQDAAAEAAADLQAFIHGKQLPLVILHHHDVVGSVTAYLDHNTAELAYWIDAGWEGRGIVTRALTRLTDELIHRGIEHLYLRTTAANQRSQQLARRLGFTHTLTAVRTAVFGTHAEDILVFTLHARGHPRHPTDDFGLRIPLDDDHHLVLAEPRHHQAIGGAAVTPSRPGATPRPPCHHPRHPACLLYRSSTPTHLLTAQPQHPAHVTVRPLAPPAAARHTLRLAADTFTRHLQAYL
ncbi:GNAT family N-acetyltransferase [Streptomyces sp. NPDC126514]|uniref:GNAT family N-acetyltransferase n=1 Tax=Streptomyces sp. NPDC126514 TaxID=3155210 RepID=UPI00331A79BC